MTPSAPDASASTTNRNAGQPGPVPLLHLVDGGWVEGGGDEVRDSNPTRPGEIVAAGRLVGPSQVDAAVAGARRAYPAWGHASYAARAEVLTGTAAILLRNAEAWGTELAREEGKTRVEGIGEVRRAAEIFRFYAAESTRPVGELFDSARPGESIQVIHKPIGVVAVITPFNFPIAIPAWKIAPALAYGNTVVWKPASTVPLLAMRLTQALVDAGLPAGVLSLLIADGPAGAQLVEHDGVDAVTFTGSTPVGRGIIANCGALARPVQTEMGGKNAAAVLADADLELAATEVMAGAFRSTGQKCTATSRLIVHDKIADEFLSILADRARELRVGDPLDPTTEMGPVISMAARDNIQQAIDAAIARKPVRVIVGGQPYDEPVLSAGAFLAPTIVEVTGDDALWREEVFGPVLTVRRAGDDRAALDLINASAFGLSASVFTDNLRSIAAAVDSVEVGVLHINSETSGAAPHVPFGGTKQSAYGPKEQGRAAREFYTTTKTVYIAASTELPR